MGKVKQWFADNNSDLLIGVGLVGMAGTMLLTVRATNQISAKIEKMRGGGDSLDNKNIVRNNWKYAVAPIMSFAASSIMVLNGHKINKAKAIALSAACKLSETALVEYSDKINDLFGIKQRLQLQDEISTDRMKKTRIPKPIVDEYNAIGTGSEYVMCFEPYSGRYFIQKKVNIDKALNNINDVINQNGYISLNEVYEELDLEGVDNSVGDLVGWSWTKGLLTIFYSSKLSEEGIPCMVISFDRPPTSNYQNRA